MLEAIQLEAWAEGLNNTPRNGVVYNRAMKAENSSCEGEVECQAGASLHTLSYCWKLIEAIPLGGQELEGRMGRAPPYPES